MTILCTSSKLVISFCKAWPACSSSRIGVIKTILIDSIERLIVAFFTVLIANLVIYQIYVFKVIVS